MTGQLGMPRLNFRDAPAIGRDTEVIGKARLQQAGSDAAVAKTSFDENGI